MQVTLGRARRKLQQLAPFAKSDQPAPVSPHPPAHFDALVEAFRRRDPARIYEAYIGLNREGIRLTQLRTVDGKLHFAFEDPDGNLFRVVSESFIFDSVFGFAQNIRLFG